MQTLSAKKAKQKIAGLLRSKKNDYTRHTEQYAKKHVERMRKDIKQITGLDEEGYKRWMKGQLETRKTMGMSMSDYDLYLQAKIAKAKRVSEEIEARVKEGKYIDERIHQTSSSPTLFMGAKPVFTPQVKNSAFFSLPRTAEASVDKNGQANYTQYILLREMESGKQADSMIFRHTITTYEDGKKFIQPVRQLDDNKTVIVQSKAELYRNNYMNSLQASLLPLGPEGQRMYKELASELGKLDKFEFESVASMVPIGYIYESAKVRGKYTKLANQIKDEIRYINAKGAKQAAKVKK